MKALPVLLRVIRPAMRLMHSTLTRTASTTAAAPVAAAALDDEGSDEDRKQIDATREQALITGICQGKPSCGAHLRVFAKGM